MDDSNKIIAKSRIHGENSMLVAVDDIFHSLLQNIQQRTLHLFYLYH